MAFILITPRGEREALPLSTEFVAYVRPRSDGGSTIFLKATIDEDGYGELATITVEEAADLITNGLSRVQEVVSLAGGKPQVKYSPSELE